MRKLNLDLDTLVVQSFDTHPSTGAVRGTVVGHEEEATIVLLSFDLFCMDLTVKCELPKPTDVSCDRVTCFLPGLC